MAKKKESPEATKIDEKAVIKKASIAVASAKKAPKPKPESKPTSPVVPFARWFIARGFKPHWRSGMEAFADTAGKKTMEEWDQIFKNY